MQTILQPVVALVAWTLIMCLWMYAMRLPGMAKAKVDPDSLARDPDADLDRLLPPETQWKAHNYNHLHEAPTVFYAVMLALAALYSVAAITSSGAELVGMLGWAYVVLRILHSLVQATVNRVKLRFALFSLSQIVLIALTVLALIAVFTPPSGSGLTH
jgi:hypothetical protein